MFTTVFGQRPVSHIDPEFLNEQERAKVLQVPLEGFHNIFNVEREG